MARLPERGGVVNSILLSLPPPSFRRTRPRLESVKLTKDDVIDRAGRPIAQLYFVNRGLISLIPRRSQVQAVGGLTAFLG
jgi:hypothetical protein